MGSVDVGSGKSIVFKGLSTGGVQEFVKVESIYSSNPVDMVKTYVDISSTDWGKALAGNYSATITFTAEVVSG